MEIDRFNGNYLRLTTEDRDGHTFERVYVRPGVSVIVIPEDGKIRFVREVNWDNQRERIGLVSGYVEDGDDPLVCAQRELKAELGVTAEHWELFFTSYSEEGSVKKTQYFFIARHITQGPAHPDDDEKILGHLDHSFQGVNLQALSGEFGTTATAFALLRFTS